MGRTITGTSRADRIEQGRETEIRVIALDGNDTIILNRSDDLGGGNFVDAGNGNDSVVNFKEAGNDIRLGAGNDTYVGSGFASFASESGDVLRAGAGNDTIVVSTFKSQYLGESGNDSFFSEGWQNTFNGGAGIDTISYEPRADDPSLGGVTINLLNGFTQTGANRFETLVSIENATGSQKADTIIGNNGVNTLMGLGGNDAMDGLRGNDILVGGRGSDYMLGGVGADQFDFNATNESVVGRNRDVIDDFSRAQRDRIDLSTIDANSVVAGNQSFRFIGQNDFSSRPGELRFKDGIVSGDVNGDGRADFEIGVTGMTSMVAGDFFF